MPTQRIAPIDGAEPGTDAPVATPQVATPQVPTPQVDVEGTDSPAPDDARAPTVVAARRPRWRDLVTDVDASSARGRERLALVVGAIALPVVALVTMVAFGLRPLPIAGAGSIGQHAATMAALAALVGFAIARSGMPRPAGTPRMLAALDVAALGIAHAMIALMTVTLLAELADGGFIGATVFGLPSMLIAGTMAALAAAAASRSAARTDVAWLTVVLAVLLVEGVVASMLTASDPHWWREHLSALGTTDDASAVAFNLTLVVGGILVTTVARSATRGIPTTHEHGLVRLRRTLSILGVLLALVGLFPTDAFYWIHTAAAAAMAVVFGVVVAFLPRWIPRMPTPFVALGWAMMAVVVVLFALFAVGYYVLTAVELVVGILVVAWIILFVVTAAGLRRG